MDLLQHIKRDRARQKRKPPYRRRVFNTVQGLVTAYGLGEDFLQLLDNPKNSLPYKNTEFSRVKAKDPFEFPLFSLSTKEEYALAVAIENKVDNRYLQFAHTPEELLLAVPLYEANPLLRSEDLAHYHFETLLLYERAKIDLKGLTEQLSSTESKSDPGGHRQEPTNERSRVDSLRQRIEELKAFISEVENNKPHSR